MQPKSEAPKGRKSPKLKRMGLHERAAARMRTMIIRGELPPGSQTQETRLSKELGVSRTPLREAMKVLAAEGLIELRPNRSPRIAGLAVDGISELFEALAGIERLAAELAAERATERDLARLRTLQTRMEGHHRNGKLDEYFAINGEIHNTIVRMARNTPLREAHETLISRAERARYLALGADRRWSNSVDEHAGILAALEARDSEAAGRLLGAHVRQHRHRAARTSRPLKTQADGGVSMKLLLLNPNTSTAVTQLMTRCRAARRRGRNRRSSRSPPRGACPTSRAAPRPRSAARSHSK